MQAATKCAIEKCRVPTNGAVFCDGHNTAWVGSAEMRRAEDAADGTKKFDAVYRTMLADFVRRVDAEARNR